MSLTILQSQMEMEIYEADSQTPKGSIDLRRNISDSSLKYPGSHA